MALGTRVRKIHSVSHFHVLQSCMSWAQVILLIHLYICIRCTHHVLYLLKVSERWLALDIRYYVTVPCRVCAACLATGIGRTSSRSCGSPP